MSNTACIRWLTTVFVGVLWVQVEAADFAFRHHFIDTDLPGSSWGQTALVDLDKDGQLDFITGQKGGPIHWYKRTVGGAWERRVLGEESPSDVGGAVLDVDGDGWLDFVTGGVWYRDPGPPWQTPFARIVFDKDLNQVHDVVVGDVDGDGDLDLCGKLWRSRQDNANGGRNHVDYLENLRVSTNDKP